MTPEFIIVSVCCFISFMNLLATVFLSNAVFRLLVSSRPQKDSPVIPSKDNGLVDLKEVPTYDPRFKS